MNQWADRIRKRNRAEILRCLCTILFFLFAFFFLLNYQNDVLAYAVYMLSGKPVLYDDLVGAVICSVLLLCLQKSVNDRLDVPARWYVYGFFPSFLSLIFLVNLCMLSLNEVYHLAVWRIWLSVATVFVIVVFRCKYKKERPLSDRPSDDIVRNNLFLMAVLMFSAGMLTATKDTVGYRLKMERYMMQGDFDKALQVGKKSISNDSSLFALRVHALAQEHLLGEKLFEYPVIPAAEAMIPDGMTVKTFMYPQTVVCRYLQLKDTVDCHSLFEALENQERSGAMLQVGYDYLLCGYLLDRNLDLFARTVPKAYDVNKNLPRYYKEALILYKHIRSNPVISYSHAVLETDYRDFQELEKKYSDPVLRNTKLRDVYGDTYWYYYTSMQR